MNLSRYWVVNLGTYIFISFVSWMWGTWFMMPNNIAYSSFILSNLIGLSFIPVIWALTMKRVFDLLVSNLEKIPWFQENKSNEQPNSREVKS